MSPTEIAGEDILTRVKRELDESRESLKDEYRRMGEEAEFALELKQYREQKNQNRHEAKDIWPTDQGIFRLWRFKTAHMAINFPIHINCKPRDNTGDASTAKAMKRFLEGDIVEQPWKMYADVRDRWIGQAVAMRIGVYRWDFVHELGTSGEIIAQLVDPRAISWNRGHLHPHDPMCPSFFEKFRAPVAQAKRTNGWKCAGLEPDGGDGDMFAPGVQHGTEYIPGQDQSELNNDRRSDLIGGAGYFTGVKAWYRFEKDIALPPRPLAPDDRYMICTECEHKTEPQGEPGSPEWPEELQGGCPMCGKDMVRRDAEPQSDANLRLAKGKRLVIVAMNGSIDKPVYDGNWPCPYARSFPYAFLTTYKFPHKRVPESDISLNWTASVGSNFTKAVIYRQAHRARGVWLLPDIGLKDRNGYRYDLGDDQDDVAFFDTRRPNAKIDNIQPPQISSALFQLHELLQQSLRENEGTSDIYMPKGTTKDIPVGTIDKMIETGNMPLDQFGKYLYDAEGLSFGIATDYIRWFLTEEKAIRYFNEEGDAMFEMMKGSDQPDVDVVVTSGASMSQVRKEDVDAFKLLAQLPGPRRRRVGQLMGIDMNLLNDMDKDDFATVEWQAKLDAHAMKVAMQAQQEMGGGGGGVPPAIAQRMQGMNGGGAAPPPAAANAEMNGA